MNQAVGYLEMKSHRYYHQISDGLFYAPSCVGHLVSYLHISRTCLLIYPPLSILSTSHLTQRMKRIAEEWAVSEKNPHKTRRKSRFLGPNGELLLTLSTSSSPQPPIQPQYQAAQDQAVQEQAGPSATEPAESSRSS